MENLKEQSIKLGDKKAHLQNLLLGKKQIINLKSIPDGVYCHNYHAIVFTVDNDMYVTKYTPDRISRLEKLGIVWKEFYVPFSKMCIPSDREQKQFWKNLK